MQQIGTTRRGALTAALTLPSVGILSRRGDIRQSFYKDWRGEFGDEAWTLLEGTTGVLT